MPLEHKTQRKSVLIVGGGFAGLAAAKYLTGRPEVRVLLLDQKNHHLFQPLLYQVATAGLNASDIAVPIRSQFSKAENVEVYLARVQSVKLDEKIILTDKSSLSFDYLILACGAHHTYFGHPEWETFAPGLKTIEQALEIRRRILSAFELAENEVDPEQQRRLTNFVIVGGGPTGVELAGAIAEIARTVLIKDFKRINPASARVILVEAMPSILSSFSSELSQRAIQDLRDLGVEIRLNAKVEAITAEGITLQGGEHIPAANTIWAAGVEAAKLSFIPEVEKDRAGRIKVAQDFSIPSHPDILVVGDMAAFAMQNKQALPGLAPAAMQAGRHVAMNIIRSIHGQPRVAFHYKDKGQMATIGKRKAIMQVGSYKSAGFFAWIAWFFIHVFYLVSFRNRISVIAQWIWSYLFSKRGARLITEPEWKQRA